MTLSLAETTRWFDLARDDAELLSRAAAAARSEHENPGHVVTAWLERCAAEFEVARGCPSPQSDVIAAVAAPPDLGDDTLTRCLPLLALASARPAAVAFMQDRDIGDDVILATLADVGRTVSKNRVWFGRAGLDTELAVWLVRHLHAAIFQLGRLQFERTRVAVPTAAALAAAGAPTEPGEIVLSLHIAAGLGPLTPAACDESIDRARWFFAEHFGGDRARFAICESWLLDRQLSAYLPASSNILAFQRRFVAVDDVAPAGGAPGHADDAVRRFVFGESRTALESQPRTTSLERAIHDHLRSGGHFRTGRGWFALQPRLRD